MNYISDIAIDGNDNKWIGTFTGVSVFNEKGLSISIEESTFVKENLTIYPNPAKGVVNIEFLSETGIISHTEIYGLQGRQIKYKRINAKQGQLDLKGLPKGLYFIRMNTDLGVVVKKLIKQ